MNMFRGQFEHTVDAKGRVSLPARFRDALEGTERWVVTPALFDSCLHVYPEKAWCALEEKIAELPSMDPHVVRFRRLYVSAACECELDKAGRILVPPHFRDRAKLGSEVLWAGMGKHAELWSRLEWQRALDVSAEEEASFKKAVLEQMKI